MTDRNLKQGDIVRHFKWETLTEEEKAQHKYLYEIIGTATHTETREPLMIYRALYGTKELYARPLAMFLGEVDKDKYPNIKQQWRFEKVESDVDTVE